MTQQRELKRRIRLRMRVTGEGYMQARAAVISVDSATQPSRPTPRDDRSTPAMTLPPPGPAWTPRAQVLMRDAESVAIRFRHQHVGTEHLLLALIGDPQGIAGHLLQKLGVAEQLKTDIHELFADESYYTAGVMVLDEEGHPIIDPETGHAKHKFLPPTNE